MVMEKKREQGDLGHRDCPAALKGQLRLKTGSLTNSTYLCVHMAFSVTCLKIDKANSKTDHNLQFLQK